MPWFLYLKNKGHKLVLVDPYTDALCVAHADIHLVCDARDIEKILEEINRLQLKIDMVTSEQTDVSTETIAILSERLGIPSNPHAVVRRFSNKLENRKFLFDAFDDHYPKFQQVKTVDEIITFQNLVQKNLIVKPVDAQSSRGIFLTENKTRTELVTMLEAALAFSKADYCIAEMFLEGTEFTVEGLCLDGQHTTLAISRKKHFRTGIASELKYPSGLDLELENALVKFHNAFVQATGLQNAITHTEYIVDETSREFWMVESACRGGGSLIPSHIVPWVSGVDVYGLLYKKLFDQKMVELPESLTAKSALLYFFEFAAGKVIKISGLESAKKINGVLQLELEFNIGDQIYAANDDRGRQGYVIILAEDDAELQDKLEMVKNAIEVVTE